MPRRCIKILNKFLKNTSGLGEGTCRHAVQWWKWGWWRLYFVCCGLCISVVGFIFKCWLQWRQKKFLFNRLTPVDALKLSWQQLKVKSKQPIRIYTAVWTQHEKQRGEGRGSILSLSPSLSLWLPCSLSRLCIHTHTRLPPVCVSGVWPVSCVCSVEDMEQQKKQDSDSGVGSDNGDKRLSATEVCVCVSASVCLCICVSVCGGGFCTFVPIWL